MASIPLKKPASLKEQDAKNRYRKAFFVHPDKTFFNKSESKRMPFLSHLP